MSKLKLLSLSTFAVAALGSVPAAALTTFASFSPFNSDSNVRYESGSLFTAPNGVGPVASVNVLFNYLVGGPSTPQGVSASYTQNVAIPGMNLPATGPFSLAVASGSFSFLSNEVVTAGGVDYAIGTNLLSGSFADGFFEGTVGGTSGAVRGSTDGGATITYSSDILDFSNVSTFDFSLPLTAVTPPFGPGGGMPQSFTASMGGQFSSEPAPGLVPEPASWAMMIVGFGIVGVSARRRKPMTVAA